MPGIVAGGSDVVDVPTETGRGKSSPEWKRPRTGGVLFQLSSALSDGSLRAESVGLQQHHY